MAVRKNGDRWVVEFMQRGVRVFRRLAKDRTKADAQALESKLRTEIFYTVDLGRSVDPPIDAVIRAWLAERVTGRKSEKQTRNHADQVLAVCGDRPLSDIGAVARAVSAQSHLAPSTRNLRLCVLKGAAKFAFQRGLAKENLSGKVRLIENRNARHRYLLPLQVAALLRAAESKQDRAFIAWAVYTGMRQGEILALGPEDVLENAIRIKDSKTGLPRVVPIVRKLRPYLSAIPFKSHKRTLYKGFERARDKAKLGDFTYHDLRHTTASLMINAGVPLYVVGELLGHKSVQTTRRYAHLATDTMRAALNTTFGGGRGRRRAA